MVERIFWWPDLRKWVEAYVKGCAECQQNKPRNHPPRVPSFRIPTLANTLPFQTISLDLITQLPLSRGYNAILTIVDHGCTRAALFLPCKTTITGEGVAKLYMDNVYRWFGLPTKVISDRDPRFTSHFAKGLTKILNIQQNISTAFHPQTDGLTERKNQWIEGYLRHLTSAQQNDWADWLAIATAVHNHFSNATTKVAPIQALLGYHPRLDHSGPPSMNERAEERTQRAFEARETARAAINKWAGQTPDFSFKLGDKVWLEAKNLTLPYVSAKLAPRRHGPFRVTKLISPVAYQLDLPPSWTIHNVFHAGLLTPYSETLQHGSNFPRPPPEIIDGETEFEVEAIRNHRFHGRRRKLQYLIGWKGYPSADNTWEDADQTFAPELIAQYHRHRPLTKDKRTSSSRRVNIRSIPCLQAIPPSTLPPPPPSPTRPTFPHSSSTRMTSSLMTTAKPSKDLELMSKTVTRIHPCLSALGLKPWDPSAPHLSHPPQLLQSSKRSEREAQLKLLVTWLEGWLPLSSRAHSSLNASNVSKPPSSARSETVLQLLLGRTCGDYLRSLKALTPHQTKIFHLITRARNQQLYQWNVAHGLVAAPRMVSSTMAGTSPTSSSQNQADELPMLRGSSPPPSSVTPPATPSMLKGPLTDPSYIPSHFTPSPSNRHAPSTAFPPGFSPYSTRRPRITTLSSRPPTGMATGGLPVNCSGIESSLSSCIGPKRESTSGRRSVRRSTRDAIAVASASSERARGTVLIPFSTSRKSRMTIPSEMSHLPSNP